MNHITFDDIYIVGDVMLETDNYIHYHYPEMLSRYDSNFIQFKSMPNLLDFQDIAANLMAFHQQHRQTYVNFHFPENSPLPTGLQSFLRDAGYEISLIELYAIEPNDFPQIQMNTDIEIKVVDEQTLPALLQLQFEDDLQFGRKFAKEQAALTKGQFENEAIEYVLAFYKGESVGYVELIISEQTVEINDLTVLEKYRHRGIGSHMQKYVMDTYASKIIILIADGEDTPRDMYRKQQYTYCGFRYEAIKI